MKLTSKEIAKIQAYLKSKGGRQRDLAVEIKLMLRKKAGQGHLKSYEPSQDTKEYLEMLSFVVDLGAEIIKEKKNWGEIYHVINLIFDVEQVTINPLIKKNNKIKKVIKLKVQEWGVPNGEDYDFEKVMWWFGLILRKKVPKKKWKRNWLGRKKLVETGEKEEHYQTPSKAEVLAALS